MNYTASDLITLAKRAHNTKRTYLLVDPLQGKHIPVSPTKSLEMMSAFGQLLASRFPEIDLVIGFAETATAISSVVSSFFPSSHYIQTTRELFLPGTQTVDFTEEHSHATEQALAFSPLDKWLLSARCIALIDDEISTGKTILNIVASLRRSFPSIADIPVVVGSIINRLTSDRLQEMHSLNITCCSLLTLPYEDLTEAVRDFEISDAALPPQDMQINRTVIHRIPGSFSLMNPRLCLESSSYHASCSAFAASTRNSLCTVLHDKRTLVLGTEECMYPGLVLARELESSGVPLSVRFHATTRSPIGICSHPGYPIQNGYRLHSFYAPDRPTFLYNLGTYDATVIVTDSKDSDSIASAVSELSRILSLYECSDIYLIEGSSYVQHI